MKVTGGDKMEIGSKIKEARMKIELTQEQVAETLGVSRQTISNWETGKSYPDIVSVIKMSDLYEVSLDYLLKGKESETMTKYINYLEESTNMVKSKQRFSKLIQIGIYIVLWAACLLWFWIGRRHDPTFAPAFAIMALYLILPIATFVISVLIGKDDSWGRYRWLMAFFFGAMHSLECFGTFKMANTLAFGNQHLPGIEDAIPAIVISLLGMGIGFWLRKRNAKKSVFLEQEKYNDNAMKSFDLKRTDDVLEKYRAKECIIDLMEPLADLEDRKVQLILKEINNTTLLFALAGASGKVCIKFMRNLSGRMTRFMDEQLQAETFKEEEIKEAQIVILQVASVVR